MDAPAEYGPHKTLYNRFKRWSENGVFERIFTELAKVGAASQPDTTDVLIPSDQQYISQQPTYSGYES